MNRKAQKKDVVPRQRFPEFRDAGEWEVKHGNSLFIPISNKEHDGSLPVLAITQENGAIPRHLIDYHVSVTEKSLKSYKVVEIGDFIISLRTFQGGIEYSDYKGICSPAYIVLRKATNEVVNDFFRHYFKTKKYIADLNRNLEGLRDGKMVSYKQFSEIKLPLPSPPEQQKIADCLSSLDELIELEARQCEALRQHKKGLMQQLFPREGETTPRLRFPEFRDAREWKKKRLEPYLKQHSERMAAAGCELSVYSSSRDGLKLQKEYFAGRELANESEYGVVPAGYFVYRHMSDDTIFKFNINDTGVRIAVSKEYPVFTTKNLDSRFLLFLLNEGVDFRRFAETQRKGGTRTRLYFKTLCSCKLPLPSLPEQQKIADCLSSLDELIELQAQKVEALRQHKKGLMQQLFPQELA